MPPPIVAGLQAVLASGFFHGEVSPIEARSCVVLSDDEFEKDPGYDEVMRAFKALGVRVASFVSPESDYRVNDLRRNHAEALTPLAEGGTVVAGQVDPVQMIAEWINYSTGERVRQLAASDPRVTEARTLASRTASAPIKPLEVHIPFNKVLAARGLGQQAALIAQGRPALTDGNK